MSRRRRPEGASVASVLRTREGGGALLLGIGVGALLDGFVLHQLLQWHHLWSSRTTAATLDGLERNTLADGVFHVVFLLVLLAGAAMLAGRRADPRLTAGLVLAGWGVFHVIDQLVFHLSLGAHHIRENVENPQLYDWGFFAIGLTLIAVGGAVARSAVGARPRRASPMPPSGSD